LTQKALKFAAASSLSIFWIQRVRIVTNCCNASLSVTFSALGRDSAEVGREQRLMLSTQFVAQATGEDDAQHLDGRQRQANGNHHVQVLLDPAVQSLVASLKHKILTNSHKLLTSGTIWLLSNVHGQETSFLFKDNYF
jgi:hypothetical protein